MIATFAFLAALGVSIGCLIAAVRTWRGARRRSRALRTSIETYAEVEDSTASQPQGVDPSLLELLTEATQEEEESLAMVAANEIVGSARLNRVRVSSLQKALSRIPLLAGGGGAFSVIALSGFGQPAVTLAVVSVAGGAVSAMLSTSLLLRARNEARTELEVAEAFVSELEKHWRERHGTAETQG